MSDLLSSMILVLARGIEPRFPTYEVDVLAIELDKRIWWTGGILTPQPSRYERDALPLSYQSKFV